MCGLTPTEWAKLGAPPRDAEIAAVAARQHGVISRRQLRSAGLGDTAIDHRVRLGRLHRRFRGVYAVGHTVLSARGHWMAAVLACGDGAALSHRSAAALWDIRPTSRAAIDVTRSRSGGRLPGIDIHRAQLHADDHTTVDGIPTTTVPRTLLDLADVVTPAALQRATTEAEYRGLLDVSALDALLSRANGRKGVAILREALASEAPLLRSELERLMLALCRDAGLPTPLTNHQIAGYEVDVFWPAHGLVVEVDGWAAHRTRRAFERDRGKSTALTVAGYRVVRFTWNQLTTASGEVIASLGALLADWR